uniref:Putative glycosyl transferase n=1 Tax=Yersinia pseudotuberculosis TaxID=633 RepID=G4WJB6_YERPU|nr:putative glycosyl transferase [Yersinia pseudotuberculosis]
MFMPLVSVIICTNRNDTYLDEAVNSIVFQTYPKVEILLVVNNVSDIIYNEIVCKFRYIKNLTIYRTKIHGVMSSRNLGLHYSNGKYVAIMDSDDISELTRIEQQVAFLEINTHVDVCGSNYYIIDENGIKLNEVSLPQYGLDKLFWRKNPICHPTCLIKKETLLSSGGYSGYSAEDYELWLRLLVKNVEFRNISSYLLGYRVPITSRERFSKLAYVHVAGAQLKMFLLTWNLKWIFGVFLTIIKMLCKSKQE